MHKYDVMGHTMFKLSSLGYSIRKARDVAGIIYTDKEKELAAANYMLDYIVKEVYRDELNAAKTDEEKEAVVLEIPGDFLIYKKGEGKHDVLYFQEFINGQPVLTRSATRSMKFDYYSTATQIAAELGEGWIVMDMCSEAHEDAKRLLDAIFSEE